MGGSNLIFVKGRWCIWPKKLPCSRFGFCPEEEEKRVGATTALLARPWQQWGRACDAEGRGCGDRDGCDGAHRRVAWEGGGAAVATARSGMLPPAAATASYGKPPLSSSDTGQKRRCHENAYSENVAGGKYRANGGRCHCSKCM